MYTASGEPVLVRSGLQKQAYQSASPLSQEQCSQVQMAQMAQSTHGLQEYLPGRGYHPGDQRHQIAHSQTQAQQPHRGKDVEVRPYVTENYFSSPTTVPQRSHTAYSFSSQQGREYRGQEETFLNQHGRAPTAAIQSVAKRVIIYSIQ